jgi:hypothetical protein
MIRYGAQELSLAIAAWESREAYFRLVWARGLDGFAARLQRRCAFCLARCYRGWRARRASGRACRKLNPGILVMQSAQGWATKNVPGAIDGARDRCIFLQG